MEGSLLCMSYVKYIPWPKIVESADAAASTCFPVFLLLLSFVCFAETLCDAQMPINYARLILLEGFLFSL